MKALWTTVPVAIGLAGCAAPQMNFDPGAEPSAQACAGMMAHTGEHLALGEEHIGAMHGREAPAHVNRQPRTADELCPLLPAAPVQR
jgi:hypothetical protein